MPIVTEAAHWVWIQQSAQASALQAHLGISARNTHRVLERLAKRGVVKPDPAYPGQWLPTPMPTHFFQKKGRSLYRHITIYLRPHDGAQVVGVIDNQHLFLTHSQQGDWWLVCDHQGRIGYIKVEALRLVHLE